LDNGSTLLNVQFLVIPNVEQLTGRGRPCIVIVCSTANHTASLRILLKTCSSAAKPQHLTMSLSVPCVSVSAPAQIKIEISQPARLAVWLVGAALCVC